MKKKKKKSYASLFLELIIVYAIIFILYLMSLPNYKHGHGPNHQKACYANLRLIQGAVEMYNMDSKDMMTELDVKKLIDTHYLKSEPRKPEKECNYYSNGDLRETGEVCCDLHGGLIAKADSEIGRKREIEEQLRERKREIKKRENKLEEKHRKIILISLLAITTVVFLISAFL